MALLQEEAATICKTSFGHVFCTTIGKTLELEATEYLGFAKNFFGSWDAHAASIQKKTTNFSNNWKVVNAGIGAVRAGSEAIKHVETVQKQAQEQQQANANATTSDGKPATPLDPTQAKETMEKLEDTLPAIIDLAWAINVRDITRTLKQVCFKLFNDASVDQEVRIKRAEAIRMLGKEFFEIGHAAEKLSSDSGTKEDIKLRAEIAAMTTLAKAQGQEISEKDAEFMIKHQRQMKQQQQQATAGPSTAQPSTQSK